MDKVCDSCGKSLIPVFPGYKRRYTDYPQYKKALIIDFKGGYDMYIDDMDSSTIRSIICHNCADELIQAFPWIREGLEFIAP